MVLNAMAQEYVPSTPIFSEGFLSCVMMNQRSNPVDYSDASDDELFNPQIFPISEQDWLELAAVDEFNEEMEDLAAMERYQELHDALEHRLRCKWGFDIFS